MGLKDVTNIDGGKSIPAAAAAPTVGGASSAGSEPDCYDSADEKERHSSGESVDSALSFSLSSVTSGGEISLPSSVVDYLEGK